VYCGPSGGSEPETQALIKLIREKEIKIIFSFHNVGSDVISNSNPFAKNIGKVYSELSGFRLLGPECNYDRISPAGWGNGAISKIWLILKSKDRPDGEAIGKSNKTPGSFVKLYKKQYPIILCPVGQLRIRYTGSMFWRAIRIIKDT